MFRFAHLSDVHVWAEHATLEWGDVLSKRLTGFANLRLRRGINAFPPRVLVRSLQDARQSEGAKHTVITGDITNLSLRAECIAAESILRTSPFPSHELSVIPGNHDDYVRASPFHALFAPFMQPDSVQTHATANTSTNENGSETEIDPNPFRPYVRCRGPVFLMGISTAVPTPPFIARGEIGAKQWARAEAEIARVEAAMLKGDLQITRGGSESQSESGTRPMLRVLLMHHPPMPRFEGWYGYSHELNAEDCKRVAEFADAHGFDLILHGHLHMPFQGRLENQRRTLVVECGSSTYVTDVHPQCSARYNLYDVDEKTGKLARIYTRIYQPETDSFQTDEIPIPP